MSPEQFCFWLHGFFELSGEDALSPAQAQMVREHLDLVFSKITPPLKVEYHGNGSGNVPMGKIC